MGAFVWSQFRFRRSRTATLSFAILVAAVSFTLLTSAATTSALRVEREVTENFETAYDILVRPAGSFTPLERERGLVTANYLSGIFGGISLRQYEQVQDIPGVEVAAPIANLGYVITFQDIEIPLNEVLNDDPVQLYRVQASWLAHHGRSRYPGNTFYVYYTRRNRMTFDQFNGFRELIPGRSKPARPCQGMQQTYRAVASPFARGGSREAAIDCFSRLSPEARPPRSFNPIYAGKGVGSGTTAQFPFLLAAIDPQQEDQLVSLSDTLVFGRPLRGNDDVRFYPRCIVCGPELPVIASTRTYVDESLRFDISRLRVSDADDVPLMLSSRGARRFLAQLPGRIVLRRSFSSEKMYEASLRQLARPGENFPFDNYWTLSSVTYEEEGEDRLRALPVRNPISVWKSPIQESGFFPAPPGNEDLQFRTLRPHSSVSTPQGTLVAGVRTVGRFDPARLPGFSRLTEVPLESYYPPTAEPANASSREALKRGDLLPTMSLGDYIAQPPFMLTTLDAAKRFISRDVFEGANAKAPISVIRVRVAGVTGPDRLSQERIRRVAEEIQRRTGLAVDVTAGSSRRPLLVELPAGAYGRPPLLVREGWVQKGVVVTIVSAIDRKSVGLFFLVLLVCSLFLANGALAAVRSRRREIGTLLCLGWSRSKIFSAIVAELVIVGLVAGLAGTVLATSLVAAFSLEMPLLRVLLVVPVAVMLAVVAGIIPAWRASRMEPLDAVAAPIAETTRLRSVKGIPSVALGNLLRVPGRTLVAASGLFVGVAALGVLLAIISAFRGSLVGTLLGNVIAVQVRSVDFISVGLAISLGALSVADVLILNLRERAPEFATLRASGWRDHHIRRVVTLEGLGLGILGSVPGAVLAVVVGTFIGASALSVASTALGAATAGVAVAVLASIGPAALSARMTVPAVLAEE